MKQRILLVVLLLALAGCQVQATAGPTPLPVAPTPLLDTTPPPGQTPENGPTATGQAVNIATATAPARQATATPASGGPAGPNPLALDIARPFDAGMTQLARWKPGPGPAPSGLDQLPVNLSQVGNPAVMGGLSPANQDALARQGFIVLATGEQQFEDIRESVAKVYGQPYYLTTDAAYHALHITFDELLKALEREQLHPQLTAMTRALLAQVQAYPAAGTPLEEDARLAAAYLAVGLRLLDPQAQLPGDLESQIEPQLAQIRAAAGRERSKLIPNFEDDYGAYKPVGHYAGDTALENYFQGMTWFGRVSFKFKELNNPAYQPSRAPLIITLALRQAQGGGPAPSEQWKNLNEILNFMIGPSDDLGPAEFSALLDEVYGPGLDFAALADEDHWQAFQARLDTLPAPQIHSTFLDTTAELEAARDWRLMGQRFTFDAAIFQNLIYDKVGTREKPRKLPTGPDVMAVFGSQAALEALEQAGETGYANYMSQMEKLQQAAQAQPEDEWLNRFYTGWLYSFIPQVQPKGAGFPAYMRGPAWGYKELNSALGSWAELKHDTVLYNKMPEFLAGGGPPASGPAPAYVEPNPQVFYRLAYIAGALKEGLLFRAGSRSPVPPAGPGVDMLLNQLSSLSHKLQMLGNIAVKELAGETLTEDDRYTILSCLGPVECLDDAYPEKTPLPVIAAVSGAEERVLEVGVGLVDRIYVVIPVEGRLHIAQGGVFSYYELVQPRDQRLTDEEWRRKLAASPPPRPAWAAQFLQTGGKPVEALAFRVDDVYIITEAGGTPPLNVRAQPARTASVVTRLARGTYITIIDGPVEQGGGRWWKIRVEFEGQEGWVLENPEWFERAHGQ